MKKYYNKEIPTEIHFIYGGRHSGKTYYELKKLKEEKKSVINFIEHSLNNPFADERCILHLVLRKLKGEENDK